MKKCCLINVLVKTCHLLVFQEKRTNIEKEFQNWLRDCHEQFDKQIHFAGNLGAIVRTDLPKHKQTPWVAFKSVEWDRKVYKRGQLVRNALYNNK